MSIPQYQFPPWSAPEGFGNSWIRNRDHSISVLPGAQVGAPPGFDDGASINAAYSVLPTVRRAFGQHTDTYTRGTVRLGPYDYNIATQITKPAAANLEGNGACLLPITPGMTCLYCHDTNQPGTQYGQNAVMNMGYTRDLRIDGTNAGANAVGFNIGDGRGHIVEDVTICNFAGSGAFGLYMTNLLYFTEYGNFRLILINNTTAAQFDNNNINTDVSHEYNNFDFAVFAQAGQNGLVLTTTQPSGTGVNWGGCTLRLRGNMSSQSSLAIAESLAMINLFNGAQIFSSTITAKVEGNAGVPNTSNYPYFIMSDGSSPVQQCGGLITHSLGNSAGNSLLNGAEFSFKGGIVGDPQLAKAFPSNYVSGAHNPAATQTGQPNVPPSGQVYNNYGPDFMVTITAAAGGTTAVAVNNSGTVTIPAGGMSTFFINAGATLNLTYAGGNAPAWVWQAASQMSA